MKIVKLYGTNELNIPTDYIQEIILNHDDNLPIPDGYITLTDKQIENRIAKYKEQVDEIIRLQTEQEEQARQEQEQNKPVENIISSIASLTSEQLQTLKGLINA